MVEAASCDKGDGVPRQQPAVIATITTTQSPTRSCRTFDRTYVRASGGTYHLDADHDLPRCASISIWIADEMTSDVTNLELEAAIVADPDAREGYAVYADWLLERGDIRGELINVQLARELAPEDPDLLRREQELLAKHGEGWLAGATSPLFRVEVSWRRGFIDTAVIHGAYKSDDASRAYRMLVDAPAARVLRRLVIAAGLSHHGDPPDDVSVLEALRDHPPPALRSLEITAFDDQLAWTHVGELAIAGPALAGLEELAIIAGRMTLGRLDVPRLRRLHLETGGLPGHVLADLAEASWPSLESLVIFFGTEEYGGSCTPAGVEPILAGDLLPAVTELGLCNGEFGDELAVRVCSAKILPRLHRLDLSQGTMGPDGARALLAHADRFAHLEALDLSQNYLPGAMEPELARLCPAVKLGHQKVEDEWGRYVSVSE
jgi:uncharacterized protein (TIGR02996 family)